MIKIIKTYTGGRRGVVVGLAYTCTRCLRIFDISDRDKAVYHDCKGPK